MEYIWILFAFLFGLVAKSVNVPPLIGYLAAGFLLNGMGVKPQDGLQTLADLGITLMLFTIGLKLNVRNLVRREVLVNASSHMLISTALVFVIVLGLISLGIGHFTSLDWRGDALLAFALSFSSTVCVIKLLEESGEVRTRHGEIAISILVLQDIAAVIFLVTATGKVPSVWALALPLLLVVRPLIGRVLNHSGHGELLPLAGFFLALGGYELFEAVEVKGDLGALIFGMLLASHKKATELTKSLLNFKDLFLIGFFLSIGFSTMPTMEMVWLGLALCLLLPIKYLLFFGLGIALKLRARTAYLSGLALSNFSEFGLIVAAISVSIGWLSNDWLVILALAVSFSFIATSVIYPHAHTFYGKYKAKITKFQRPERLHIDAFIQPQGAEVLVIGMGRVGSAACTALHQRMGNKVCGVDADVHKVHQQRDAGMHVIPGDAEDSDFWDQLDIRSLKLVILAIPSLEDARNVAEQLSMAGYRGQVAAIARYEDEIQGLRNMGIDKVFNYFAETGAGLAEESIKLLA